MKVEDVNKYVNDFFSTRGWYRDFFEDVRREYHSKQKPIQDTRIVDVKDFIEDIEGNLGYYWGYESLVPQVFATYSILGQSALCFGEYLSRSYNKIWNYYENDSNPPYFMEDLQKISYELSGFMRNISEIVFLEEQIPIPYLQLRHALIQHNLKGFVEKFNAMLADLPYNIRHNMDSEAYFHVCTHLILKMIGVEIRSEVETNIGRIDSTLDMPAMMYIFEHKYSKDDSDRSEEALQQIVNNSYADKYRLGNKTIYGVGFSFGNSSKKIDSFQEKQL